MTRRAKALGISFGLVILGLSVAFIAVTRFDVITKAEEDPCGGLAERMRVGGQADVLTPTLLLVPSSFQPYTQNDPATSASLDILQLPDIQYLPIYTDVLTARGPSGSRRARPGAEYIGRRSFSYEANASMDRVYDYYVNTLPQYGWEPLHLPLREGFISTQYIWTDRTGQTPWHLRLELDLKDERLIGVSSRPPVTRVHMGYERIPNTEDGLPLLEGATEITLNCTEERTPVTDADGESDASSTENIIRHTTLAYTVQLSPDTVAEYYTSYLPQYGWSLFSPEGRRRRGFATPTASISSEHGIPFQGSLYAPRSPLARGYRLYSLDLKVTAKPLEDGQTRVQLQLTKR